MRPLPAAVAILCSLVVPACGGSDDERPPPAVRIAMTGPGDGSVVREDAVRLSGRVVPAGAAVSVGGERASVSGGRFTARVPLDAGGNVIDVMATAQDRSPAMTAVRVVRRITVRVPDVRGESPDGAVERLAAAGLRAELDDVGGVLDELLPVSRAACETEPEAGATVDSGATVKVLVAKVC